MPRDDVRCHGVHFGRSAVHADENTEADISENHHLRCKSRKFPTLLNEPITCQSKRECTLYFVTTVGCVAHQHMIGNIQNNTCLTKYYYCSSLKKIKREFTSSYLDFQCIDILDDVMK